MGLPEAVEDSASRLWSFRFSNSQATRGLESRQIAEGKSWVEAGKEESLVSACENLGCEGSRWRGTGAEGWVSRQEMPESTGWKDQKERDLHSKEQSPLASDLGWKLGCLLAGERAESGSVASQFRAGT